MADHGGNHGILAGLRLFFPW